MTTTQTPIQTCQGTSCDERATHVVRAQHFDPDADEDGRPYGWSRVRQTRLCDDCLAEWREDDLTAVCDVELIK